MTGDREKDVGEGIIYKDPDYLAFMQQLAKPAEYLPRVEIQLERREAEKAASVVAGTSKDVVVVTPLTDLVRSLRAAKFTSQRSMSSNSELSARSAGVSAIQSYFT